MVGGIGNSINYGVDAITPTGAGGRVILIVCHTLDVPGTLFVKVVATSVPFRDQQDWVDQ
jgi:hypothetical protein